MCTVNERVAQNPFGGTSITNKSSRQLREGIVQKLYTLGRVEIDTTSMPWNYYAATLDPGRIVMPPAM